jgi:23S rRNA-/tRNA-specific pseudouridylate synthase
LLLAKTADFAQRATMLFAEGKVRKKYTAVVRGVPAEDEVEIDQPIRRKSGHVFEWHHDHQTGKKAISTFRVIKRLQDRSIISCTPVTGRTHQLRLHLQFWGHPVIDDPLYSRDFAEPYHAPQRSAISLRHVSLSIPDLGLDYQLNPYFTIESGLSETEPNLT